MEPKTKYNLDRICRICLSECSEMTDLFDNRRKISQIVMTCCDVKVIKDDGLPTQICSPCMKQAHLAASFKYKCEQSDARLRNYITNTLNVPSSVLDIKEELSAFEDLSDFLKYEIPLSNTDDIRTVREVDNAKNNAASILPTYECAICKEVYDSTKVLIDHVIRTHTSSVKEEMECYSCNICRKKFGEEFDLKCHQITHKEFAVNNKINTCPLCREHFPKHEVLLRHVGYHLDDSEYGCKKCNCFYTSNLHLKRHNQRMHPPETKASQDKSDAVPIQNTFTVKIEPETIPDDIEMPFDTSYPSDDNDFSLPTDDFSTGIDLQLNDSHHNDSDDSDYDTNKILSEMIEKSHKKHHKNKRKSGKEVDIKIEPEDVDSLENILNDKKSYSKEKSKKRKKKNNKLNIVEKDVLKIGKKFSCNQCPKKFLKKELLTDHIKHHSGERSYLCSKCGKGYFKQLHLDKHMATHLNDHVEKPLHICPLCGKVVKHSNHLQSHMKTHNGKGVEPQSINPNKKTHLCSTCGRSCSSLSNLAVHMRRHTGTMTCVCKICGKGYPRTTDLILHMRQHTGERPFVCCICNKGFARSDKLAIHMRTHTGEKPYICNSCGRAFAQSNDLGAHKKRNNCGQNQNATPNISRSGIITSGMANSLSATGTLLNENHLMLLSQNKALHVSSIDSSQNPEDISNKLKRNVSNQHSKALSLANNVTNLGGNEDQQLLVSAAHTRAFELAAAAAASNNLLLVSSNNVQNKVMDLADVQQIRNVTSGGKQNLTVSSLMATQRALELANHNSILAAQQQRAEYTDYTAATLLQVQSAHFLLNKLNE